MTTLATVSTKNPPKYRVLEVSLFLVLKIDGTLAYMLSSLHVVYHNIMMSQIVLCFKFALTVYLNICDSLMVV